MRETEQATSDILGSAEAIQEAAWTLRERGGDAPACDALDRHATAIYTACSFQDLTAQRTARIVYTLRYLEERLSAMIAIWGAEAERIPSPSGPRTAGPEAEPSDLCQSDIDRYIGMDVPAVTAAALVARPGSPPLHEDLVFLPVTGGTDAPLPSSDVAWIAAAASVATSEPDAETAAGDAPEPDWADIVAAVPELEVPGEEPVLSFAALRCAPAGGAAGTLRLRGASGRGPCYQGAAWHPMVSRGVPCCPVSSVARIRVRGPAPDQALRRPRLHRRP